MAGKGKPGPLGGQTNSGNADGGDRAKAPNSGSGPSAAGSFFAKAADSMASAVDAVSTTLRVKGEDLEHGIRSNLEGAYCIYAAGIQAESYAPDAILEETGCQIATLISGLKSSFIQMLEIVGATSVLGAGIGGAVGLFGGGATAVPGLVIGGELGYDVGMAALTWLGLGFLVYAITGGFAELYKALHEGVEWAWQARDLKGAAQKEQLDKAAHKIADAAGILMRLVLQGIVAELLRRAAISSGRGALARGKALGNAAAEGTDAAFIAQLRDSSFGRPFADWIEKNKADLEKNPKLKPKAETSSGGGGSGPASDGGGSGSSDSPGPGPKEPAAERDENPEPDGLSKKNLNQSFTKQKASTTIISDEELAKRAAEVHGALDPIAQNMRTTAAASVTDANGNTSVLVGSSNNTLSPAQRAALQPGETAVSGPGHAEVTVINAAQSQGMTVNAVAASRTICPDCQQAIQAAGARPVNPQ
jgi:hypothetical protein